MEGYENKEICSRCQGACCKRMPACAMPKDFKDGDLDELVKALKTGKWAVDWLDRAGLLEPTDETQDRAYFMRPAVKGAKQVYDTSKGGECTFLTSVGCKLPFESRPEGCRLMEPKGSGKCILHGANTKQAAMAWMPFKEVIENAVAHINTDSND